MISQFVLHESALWHERERERWKFEQELHKTKENFYSPMLPCCHAHAMHGGISCLLAYLMEMIINLHTLFFYF